MSVFRQCVEALYMVKDQHPQAAKEAPGNMLPIWLDAFKVLLDLDSAVNFGRSLGRTGNTHPDFQVRTELPFYFWTLTDAWEVQTLDTIHTPFPRVVVPHLLAYIAAALHHLHALYPTYVRYHLIDGISY
jgi:importin-9